MKLSVLMSIYNKENPEYFRQAMESIWDKQTRKPDEIILVEDGPLTEELYSVIGLWKNKLPNILNVISLNRNVGTGGAKRVGLENCSGNYIAIMDTDDISEPERFEKQIDFLEKNSHIDAVGTWICEINNNNQIIKDTVEYPLTNDELYKFFEKRDPIAHPTSMFRNSFFLKAGGYRSDLILAEDTLLWYYGFLNNCKIANINYIGLKFRRNNGFYKRRGHFKKSIGLLKFRILKLNRDLKYGLRADLYAIAYFFMSITPSFIKKWLYQNFR